MKKLVLSLSTFALIAASIFVFASCEKEENTTTSTQYIQESKKVLPSKQRIAAFMGIEVERIVSVSHRSGFYEGHDEYHTEYYPNGTLKSNTHNHWYICHPYDAYCCSVVRVKTDISVTTSSKMENGYITKINSDSITLFFDHAKINDSYIDNEALVVADEGAPIGNASAIGLCDEQEYAKVVKGSYKFFDFENYRYCIIPTQNIEIIQGQLIEK